LHRTVAGNAGFTLLELIVVVAIVALVAALAMPAYTKQIQKNNRAVAKARLAQAAQLLERFYSDNNTYYVDVSGGNLVAGTASTTAGFAKLMNVTGTTIYSGSNNETSSPYQVTLSTPTAATYTLTATVTSGTSQASDACGNLTLTNAGVKGISGTGADCW